MEQCIKSDWQGRVRVDLGHTQQSAGIMLSSCPASSNRGRSDVALHAAGNSVAAHRAYRRTSRQPEAKKRKQEGTGPQDVPIPSSSSSSSSSSSESNCEEEDEGQGNTAIDKTGTSPEPQSEQHDSTHEAHQADEESLTEGERLARQALDMSASAKGMPIPEEENARGQCISFGAYAHGPFSGVTNAHFSICQQRLP